MEKKSREWLKRDENYFMIMALDLEETGMKPIEIKGTKIGEGMTKICVPIVATNNTEILEQAQMITSSKADLVEFRVDWYEECFVIERVKELLVKLRGVLSEYPIVFTFRTKEEGGKREIDFETYANLLKEVADTKLIDMIDIEVFKNGDVQALIAEIQRKGVRVIGSNHDFSATPEKEELVKRLCYMRELGVDIPKMAVMPQSQKDVEVLLDATKETSERLDCPIVTMSMGELGVVSRIKGEIYGSAVTFGSLGRESAPGQIPVDELKSKLEKIHCSEKA